MKSSSTTCPLANQTMIPSSGTEKNRFGRKGDPRMHAAVAARISNPQLSLYQALIAGGFEYSNDDHADLMDSELVTLGQRKNQLSRRLRAAAKQRDKNAAKINGRQALKKAMLSREKAKPPKASPLDAASSAPPPATKEDDHDGKVHASSSQQRRSSDNHETQHGSSLAGKKRDSFAENPLGLLSHVANVESAKAMEKKNNNKRPKIEPPQVSPDLAALSALSGNGSIPVVPAVSPQQVLQQANDQVLAANLFVQSALVAAGGGEAPARAMNLEHLTEPCSTIGDLREELALEFFDAASRALCRKSMLLAGYTCKEIQDTSLAYIHFRARMWHMEGARLQRLKLNQSLNEQNNAAAEVFFKNAVPP